MEPEILKEALRKKGMDVAIKELEFFFAKLKPMSKEDRSMWRPDLLKRLREFSNTFHGKDPEKKITEVIADKIHSTFPKLSMTEVGYCLDRIVKGDEEVQKEFNLQAASVIKIIKMYNGRRKYITKAFFELIDKGKDSDKSRQAEYNFIQNALKKHSNKSHLTIYERAALGLHFSSKESKEVVLRFRKEAKDNLSLAITNLTKKRDHAFGIIVTDVEQNTPTMWTERLLFGSTIYDSLYVNK